MVFALKWKRKELIYVSTFMLLSPAREKPLRGQRTPICYLFWVLLLPLPVLWMWGKFSQSLMAAPWSLCLPRHFSTQASGNLQPGPWLLLINRERGCGWKKQSINIASTCLCPQRALLYPLCSVPGDGGMKDPKERSHLRAMLKFAPADQQSFFLTKAVWASF